MAAERRSVKSHSFELFTFVSYSYCCLGASVLNEVNYIWLLFVFRRVYKDLMKILCDIVPSSHYSFSCSRFFKEPLAIWCELIPQMLFLSSIFLYLIILIFYKWVAYTAEESAIAPSLLISESFVSKLEALLDFLFLSTMVPIRSFHWFSSSVGPVRWSQMKII